MMTVRVRSAPSPTGYLHIGNLRTMLYNYFFARKHGGAYILRIEDTDRSRTVAHGVERIITTLDTLGIAYDEGPYFPSSSPRSHGTVHETIVEKGDCGPYIQSKRLALYKKYAEELLDAGRAFRCWCTPEALEAEREAQSRAKQPTRYRGKCLKATKDPTEPHVIRLKVPETGETTFRDLIRGPITIKNELIDHTVLMKSDGYPTYHLANVVDDHLMRITHVIRGDEWIASTPKHVLLYDALGWQPPQFAHLPLLLNPDRSKLSKRQMDVAVEDYLAKGYLPDALINFVSLLGWNPTADREIYTREELIKMFDLQDVNKSGAVLNVEKLDWMNNHYLRELTVGQLTNLVRPYVERAGYRRVDDATLGKIVALEQERLHKLGDFPEETSYCYVRPHYEPELLHWKKIKPAMIRERLLALRDHIHGLGESSFIAPTLEENLKAWIASSGFEVGEVLAPFRVALTGRKNSPPPFAIAEILGKDETIARIEKAMKML